MCCDSGIVVAPCSTYLTQASDELLDDCNQFLGPDAAGRDDPRPDRGRGRRDHARGGPGRRPAARRARRRRGGATGLLDYLLGAMREARRQLAASPVLIGAVTVLVAIVAVFISYSANQGLPFVPTYKLKAELPNGAELVVGNEVRAGGFRVGVVDDITVVRRAVDGASAPSRVLELKLDKQIEPLSVDTRVCVRPRSALGLKYVELVPGRSRRTFETGDTVPLRNAAPTAPELEDVLSTFAPPPAPTPRPRW